MNFKNFLVQIFYIHWNWNHINFWKKYFQNSFGCMHNGGGWHWKRKFRNDHNGALSYALKTWKCIFILIMDNGNLSLHIATKNATIAQMKMPLLYWRNKIAIIATMELITIMYFIFFFTGVQAMFDKVLADVLTC